MAPLTEQRFTRQQVASLAGVSDDMVAYWLKQGLLAPTSGGQGRGSHRQFDFVQVNIAAIFGQLRRFGLNIGALRSLADLLQAAATLGASYSLHPATYSDAAYLANKLHRFRSGGEVLIPKHGLREKAPAGLTGGAYSDWLMAKRPATSESEILAEFLPNRSDYDAPAAILAAAEDMGPNREIQAKVYADLVYEVLAPGYAYAYSWLLALQPGEPCRIEFGSDGAKFFDTIAAESPEDFGPGIFLPVSGIIRKLWGLKTIEEHRLERERALVERDQVAIEKALADAGITAVVTVDAERGFNIETDGVDQDALRAALSKTRFKLNPAAGSQEC